MMTRRPRSAAPRAYSYITSGVRWAETTRTSHVTANSVSTSTAPCITGRSESLPMMTPTSAGEAVTRANLAAGGRPGALFGEVRLVHQPHQSFEVDLRLPAQLLARL